MSTEELQAIVANLAKSQAETDRQIKSMSMSIERMSGSVGREWGNLVESLTKTSCLEQMQEVGIEVTQTAEQTQSERKGYEQEWDVLLVNGGELVAVEVKSRFQEKHLDRVEEKLETFKKAFPQYSNYTVYGAVAALKFNAGMERLAEKRGLFEFKPSGEIMKIANHLGFKPKPW